MDEQISGINKNIVITILSLIVVFLFLFLIFYDSKIEEEKINLNIDENNEVSKKVNDKNTEKENKEKEWQESGRQFKKTYSSFDYNFKISYPGNWFVTEDKFNKENPFRLTFLEGGRDAHIYYQEDGSPAPYTHGWGGLIIFIEKGEYKRDFTNLEAKQIEASVKSKCENIALKGTEARKCLFKGNNFIGDVPNSFIAFNKNNNFWKIMWGGKENEFYFPEKYQEVIFSLNFIEN